MGPRARCFACFDLGVARQQQTLSRLVSGYMFRAVDTQAEEGLALRHGRRGARLERSAPESAFGAYDVQSSGGSPRAVAVDWTLRDLNASYGWSVTR
jgi:hypothetical protein